MFSPDFMFRLTKAEKQELVTNCDRLDRLKHSSALPRVFTEQGVAMLSSVLKSDRAIQVNIPTISLDMTPRNDKITNRNEHVMVILS